MRGWETRMANGLAIDKDRSSGSMFLSLIRRLYSVNFIECSFLFMRDCILLCMLVCHINERS